MIKGSIRRQLGNWHARLVIGLITALAAQPVWPMLALAQQPAQEPISRDIRRGSITKLPENSKRWAFIVGVNKYDIAFDQLEGAENDANRLADALIKNAGFLPNHVIRLSTDREAPWQPRRGVIINALADVLPSVPHDGLFLFAFSGHGVELEVKGTKQNFLLPMDAARNDLDPTVMTTTSIEMDEIKGRIKNRGVKQVIMLIDSCRSDPTATRGVRSIGANNLVSDDYLNRFNFDERNSPIEAFVVLLASSAGQRAYEYPKAKMGFFTWAIVQALACEDEGREACNEKGQLTLGGLKRYLQQKIPAKVLEVYGVGVIQKPRVFESEGYQADELVLAIVPRASGNKSSSATAASPEIERDYWGFVKEKDTPEQYLRYQTQFPNGEFVEEARQRIANFEPVYWKEAESMKDPAGYQRYQRYLDYFPTGPHAAEAKNFLTAERQRQQEEIDWMQAKQENTRTNYGRYLNDYPNGKYAGETKLALANLKKSEEDQRENDDWKQAVSSNNIAGYQAYLNQYPQGRFGVDANRTIDELRRLEEERRENYAWELAKNSQSIAGYQAYLKDFQNGPHAAESNAAITAIKEREELARRRAEEDAAWEKAKSQGSLQSYQEYLNAYPRGRYAESANSTLAALRLAEAEKRRTEEENAAWERAKSGASKQSYNDYLGAYPQGRFIAQARQSIGEFVRIEEEKRIIDRENAAWQQAKNANTLASYQAYQKDYPAGRFAVEAGNGIAEIERAEEAKRQIAREDAAWTQAQQGANLEAYQNYLTAYPNGRFIKEANTEIGNIRQRDEQQRLITFENDAWETAKRSATTGAYQTYLTAYPNGRFVADANTNLAAARDLEEQQRLAAEDTAWTQAKNTDTLVAYQAYLKNYPQGRYFTAANNGLAEINRRQQIKREDDAWTQARQSPSIVVYQAYLAEYPQGRYVTAANDGITAIKRNEETRQLEAAEAAAWQRAEQSASGAGYQAYLRDHPSGKYAEEARKGIAEFERIEGERLQRTREDASWKQAQQGASLQSYQTYLAQYPAGRFVADANKELATIEDADWARAQRGANIESYQTYQTTYPNGRYSTTAGNAIVELQRKRLSALDEAAWTRAQQGTNVAAYQSYLTEYPRGRFVTEANQRITDLNLAAEAQRVVALDDAAWGQAQQNATSAAYQTYLNTYPKGRFVAEATRRLDESKRIEENQRLAALDEAAWTSARTNTSLAAYQGYLTTYPKGRFATDANNAIAGLNRLEAIKREDDAWQQSQKDNTLAAYQSYLTDYPAGRYVETANQRVTSIKRGQDLIAADENAWQTAQTGANLAAYQSYLKDYPNGRYVTSANNSITEINRIEVNKREDQAWEQAHNSANLAGYQAYLTAYPNGRFVAEANTAAAEFAKLEASKREEQDWATASSNATLAAYRAYLTSYSHGRFTTEAESLVRAEELKLEDAAWEQAWKDASLAAFQAYLSNYPNGRFATEANTRIAELNNAAALSTILAAPITPRDYRYSTKLLKPTGEDWELTKPKAKKEFAQELGNQVALEMVAVNGGSFYMGTSNTDVAQVLDEYKRNQFDPALADKLVERQRAQRKVKIEAFYLGKHEVTQAQWRAVAALPKVKRDLNTAPSYFKGDDLPVEQVSWEDAVEFCERLSRAAGRKYRLPTEAEWEYASRAGREGAFAFGETLTTQVANYHGGYPYGSGPTGEYRGMTIKPGSLRVANAYGLFDMHGNVSEWVQDPWHDNYRGAPNDGRSWAAGSDEKMRVIRGGSWNDRSIYCRSAHRTRYESYLYSNTIGFRVALSVSSLGK